MVKIAQLVLVAVVGIFANAEDTRAVNTAPFSALHKGINLDVTSLRSGLGPKVQYDKAQMQAIAEAGFESVRVFMPYSRDIEDTQVQIDDALANGLSIVVVMWGMGSWNTNPSLGQKQIAQKWGQVANLWKHYSNKLVFEVLNEPAGINLQGDGGNAKAMGLYNAAIQAIRDEDPNRPVLIGAPGYNDPEFLEPYLTEKYLNYTFGGKGFYSDPNVGAAIHFYTPRGSDGLNFAMWTQELGQDDSKWQNPITKQIMYAVNWRKNIGHDIPIVTTEWGCWMFESRTQSGDLAKWADFHMNLFHTHNIGNMWYVGIQNNARAFSIFDTETGWNQVVLGKLTGVQPSKWPIISQMINGEFLGNMEPWQLSKVSAQIIASEAYSGNSVLKVTSAGSGGQLYIQTHDAGEHPPGRMLLHLIQGSTYKISFMSGADAGQHGRIQAKLKDASDQKVIKEFDWIDATGKPTTNSFKYKHNSATVMDVRLEFDVGSVQQVLYVDAVEFIRDAGSPTPPAPTPKPSPAPTPKPSPAPTPKPTPAPTPKPTPVPTPTPGRKYERLTKVCQNGRPIGKKFSVSSVEDCESHCDTTPGCVAVNTDGQSCYTVATCEGQVDVAGSCTSWCGYRVVSEIIV